MVKAGQKPVVLEFGTVEFQRAERSFALYIPEFVLKQGESVFLHGPSGCGKSTFLKLAAGLLNPNAGSIRLGGTELTKLSEAKRDQLRADQLGFVFQQFNLIDYLSVLDNVTLPCRFSSARRQRAEAAGSSLEKEAETLLIRLGLADCMNVPSFALSVGQQQRVAAARALLGSPPLLLADEPTSALDEANQQSFIELLLEAGREKGTSILFVSHNLNLKQHFDRSESMLDWRVNLSKKVAA